MGKKLPNRVLLILLYAIELPQMNLLRTPERRLEIHHLMFQEMKCKAVLSVKSVFGGGFSVG